MDCLSDSCVLVIWIMVCSGFAFSGVPFCLVSGKMEGNKSYKVVSMGFSFEDLKLLFSVSVCFGVFMYPVVLFY